MAAGKLEGTLKDSEDVLGSLRHIGDFGYCRTAGIHCFQLLLDRGVRRGFPEVVKAEHYREIAGLCLSAEGRAERRRQRVFHVNGVDSGIG